MSTVQAVKKNESNFSDASIRSCSTSSNSNVTKFISKKTEKSSDEIPSIIKELTIERRSKKMTQSEIAEKMNTTASAIARLESGGGKKRHSPSLRTLESYAKAIDSKIEVKLVVNKKI